MKLVMTREQVKRVEQILKGYLFLMEGDRNPLDLAHDRKLLKLIESQRVMQDGVKRDL